MKHRRSSLASASSTDQGGGKHPGCQLCSSGGPIKKIFRGLEFHFSVPRVWLPSGAQMPSQPLFSSARKKAMPIESPDRYDTARKSFLPIPTPIWRLPAIVQSSKNVSPLRLTVTVPEYVEPLPGLVPDTR